MQMRTIMTRLSKNKVVLGLSGGVDSSTAALLLKEKGMEVIGFYFDVSGDNAEGAQAAENLAERLGIKFIKADVSREFEQIVIRNFCVEYRCGHTPNPCVICNPNIKFKKLIEIADREGAYYIATGHYARIHHDETNELYYVRKGANERKDQSYMLYRLGQDVLSRLIFPLGGFDDKEKTREMARDFGLPNAETADSQEICFIDETQESYQEFLTRKGYKCKEGDFVDADGNVLGRHKGIMNFTIGQRKGLGIALGKPAFVTEINPENNQVTLGSNDDLFKRDVYSIENVFADGTVLAEGESLQVRAKIRYASKPAEAVITVAGEGRILTSFSEPQRAATPGQSIVFYVDDYVIGGGFID